jgi:hypothetical protein
MTGGRGGAVQKAARLASGYMGEAIETLAQLMRHSKRDSVRKDAATALIALGIQEAECVVETEEQGELRLVDSTDAVEEARRRASGE